MAPKPGDLISNKYRVLRLIGEGGMGAVYEGRHEVLGAPVALKFLHADLARRPGLATRFLQEARVTACIQSPHVARVTDVDTADGCPYLVMELLRGESLQALIDRLGRLPVDQALDYTLQTLMGLEAAHSLGVVHRDLKPDNLFVTPSTGGPVVKIIDFGIAKLRASNEYTRGLTRAGVLMGTPEYMAPEQLYSANLVDHRADLYSVGAILYEMLSGQRPADGDDAAVIVAQVSSGAVKPLTELVPELNPALATAAHRALVPEREQRYGDAAAMRLALLPFVGQLSHAGKLAATPPPPSVADAAPLADAAPAAPAAPGGVPATLPPEEACAEPAPAAEPKGTTQEVSPEVIRQNIVAATHANAQEHPAAPLGPAFGAGYTGNYVAARRRQSRWPSALLAVLLGAGVTGAAIYWVSIERRNAGPPPEVLPALVADPPSTTIASQVDLEQPPAPAQPSFPQPSTTPAVTPKPKPPKPAADAGAPAASDAGTTSPPPLGLPSTFPPLPSSFPTALPSSFPTIPGLPPLGFPTQKPDGGR
jgi:serine/threonine-protein kinase